MTAPLTEFSSDMVFGVGLGCLVQMLKTHADVQVIDSNTQFNSLSLWSNKRRMRLFWNP